MAEKIHEKGGSLAPIYDRLSTAGNYHPYSAETFSDWSLESGDVITLYKEGTPYQSPVYTSRMVWRGAPETTLTTTGNQEREAVAKLGNRKYGGGGGGYRNTDLLDTRFTQNQEMILMEAWDRQDQYKQFYSNFQVTAKKISAVVTKANENGEMLKQAGFELTADGFLVYAVDATKPLYITSMFQVLADTIRAEIEDNYNGLKSYIELTADHLRSEFESQYEGLRSYLELTAEHLRAEFERQYEGLRSYVELTAEHLQIEFENSYAGLRSYVELTAEHLQIEFENSYAGLKSYVELTAEHLQVEFENSYAGLKSYVELTAEHLAAEFESQYEGMRSYLELTAEHLQTEFENQYKGLKSYLELTAENLTAEFENQYEGLKSYLELTAESLTSEFESQYEGLRSYISQTAGDIRVYVENSYSNLQSQITVNANAITTKVSAGDIASTINQTAQSVQIQASKIDLSGYVSATELDTEKARISNLETQLSAAGTATIGNLTSSNAYLTSLTVNSIAASWHSMNLVGTVASFLGNMDANLQHSHRVSMAEDTSAGTVTITIHEAQSTEGTANFSIAATETYKGAAAAGASNVNLSGAWSGNVFTVTATNGKTRPETLTAGTGTGNQSVGGQYTIDTFNSSHKAYGYVNASSLTGSRLFTFNVDATSVYEEGAATASVGDLVLNSYSGATFQAMQYAADNSTLLASANGQIYLDESAGSYTRSCWACVRPTGGSRIAYIALADYWDAAQAAVTPTTTSHLKKGSWSAGQLSITKTSDSGYPDSVSVQLTLSGSWGSGTDANKYTYTVYDDRTSTGLTGTITAPSSSGYTIQQAVDLLTAGITSAVGTARTATGTVGTYTGSITVTSVVNGETYYINNGLNGATIVAKKAYEDGQSSVPTPSVVLSGSWSGNTFTVTNTANNNKVEEVFSYGKGTGNQTAGGQYTINEFNSSYKAYGYVNATRVPGSRLVTFNVDATSVFNAGWNACIDYMTENNGVSCLVYYSTWQPGAMRALYEFNDGMYTKATGTNQYWRYSGSVVTRYSLPDRK